MRRILIATPLFALAAVACTGTASYKDQTEDYLNDKGDVEEAAGGDVTGADCQEPDSTDAGTTYSCTADVEGVGSSTFNICIDKEDSFLVQIPAPGETVDPNNPPLCPPAGSSEGDEEE